MTDLATQLAANPQSFVQCDYAAGFAVSAPERDQAQLEAARQRFAALSPRIAPLGRMAAENGITEINCWQDLAPLLFPHTVYKSYPLSFIEQGRFDRMTKWLGSLTTTDLSRVILDGVDTIDDWLRALEAGSDLAPIHTFGTSGKLSILPRTKAQLDLTVRINANCIRDFAPESGGQKRDLLVDHLPLISPSYRMGASSIARGMNRQAELYAGGQDNALFLYPDAWFSADVLSLAGRLRAAEARGEAGNLALPASLIARRNEFAAREASRGADMDRFFDEALHRFGGQDVFLFAVWPILFEWAEEGLKRGLKNVFGPGSILTSGGGSKGKVMPADYKQQIFEFLGFDRCLEFFGMTELMANAPKCEHGNFHFPPVVVPFLLDPDSGAMLPRDGRRTGRLALLDLLPESYWGGLVSGDRVTMAGFDAPCACGRHGPYLEPDIARFSDIKDGDDKINCAGAPEAHDKAIDFLLEQSR
ncbi:hypothetical protein [Novosphingobium sp. B 225]|uniref:hypothetical protein n=1 Tax=Novosphingobium sp. B 225 TaxID=1961849 RepID=UPI000B4B91AD|nr:hypothetical protein [Novosphingobium sp. B 225]